MKKISLLFVMMLAFTVSTMAQSLPKPATPSLEEFIDYGREGYPVGINLAYHIPQTLMTQEPVDGNYSIEKEFDVDSSYYHDYTVLDPAKVSFSIFTDNNKIFTFTPELFPDAPIQVTEPITQFPYTGRLPNGSIGYWDIHFKYLTNIVEEGEEPFFTWRIGIQTYFTDNGQTSESDIYYMEVYPQLKEAAQVTSTSFLADWDCDAENTYMLGGFQSYDLYIINMDTQETTVIENVEPTHPQSEINEQGVSVGVDYPIPGATQLVEGLTPGTTYQYYVVCSDSYNSFKSAVREVTLPLIDVYMLGGDDQGWDPTQGAKFEYDAENNVYTLNYTFPAENNYFGFTTKLAENNIDNAGWGIIEPYRFGAIADEGTDFIWYDQYNGQPIDMTWDAYHAIKIAGGEYKLTVNLTDMTLIIEKVVPDHGYEVGDVNHDKAINIADVTALIDHLLGTGTVCEICADVNGDSNINIADVTALIDKLLNIN